MANLMRWDPFSELYSIRDTVNRMFGGQPWQPMVDVLDRQDRLIVRADLPGFSQDEVEVTVDEDCVILKGENRQENEEEGQGYFRRERTLGAFTRTIPLNVAIKPDESRATFKNGVLEIVLPKVEHARPKARRIEIQ